jgi:hypothetical protein
VGSLSLSAADKERLLHVVMALEALCNVIKNNPGTEELLYSVSALFSPNWLPNKQSD